MCHARKERVLLVGTDQRITSGPAATAAAFRGRIHGCTRIVSRKVRFFSLSPRVPSILGTSRHFTALQQLSRFRTIADTELLADRMYACAANKSQDPCLLHEHAGRNPFTGITIGEALRPQIKPRDLRGLCQLRRRAFEGNAA